MEFSLKDIEVYAEYIDPPPFPTMLLVNFVIEFSSNDTELRKKNTAPP